MSITSKESDALLSFENVNYQAKGDGHASLNNLSFALYAGQLMTIKLDSPSIHIPLADLAAGLQDSDDGDIYYQSKRWASRSPFSQCRLRAGIRRNYPDEGWVSNLTVFDNILLSSRHHYVHENALLEEAETLASSFGVSPIPRQLPALCVRHILRRCDWVRMFVGSPELIILDRPLIQEGSSASSEAFVSQLNAFMTQGGSCVWMDHNDLPEQLQAMSQLCYSQGSFTDKET